MKRGLMGFICLLLWACDNPLPSIPDPPPTTTTTAPAPPPRVDQPFQFEGNIGFSLFAGARATEEEIRSVFSEAQSRLGGRPFARVCGEVHSWPNRPWLPRGASAKPFDETAPAYLELEHFLGVAATIPNAQVLLVPICNLKEDGTNRTNRTKWVRTTARLASRFANVALEVVNEWKHPNSTISEGEIRDLLRVAKAECPTCLVGTDAGVHPGNLRYPEFLRPLVDYPSVHPWRDPRPSRREIRRLVDKNGGFLVLSETTAYNDGSVDPTCDGLRTCDRNEIIRYLRDCQATPDCVFVYHSIWGLGWPALPMGWFPPGA